MSPVGDSATPFEVALASGRELATELADERSLHGVTLDFLDKLISWGWGDDAPDLAKQEWAEAEKWLKKVRGDG